MFTFFSWIFFIALIAVIWWRIHLYRKNRPKGKDLGKFIGKSVLWFFATSVVCSIALIATAPDEDDSANSVKPKTHKVEKNKKKSSKSESKEKQKAEAKKEKEKEEKQKAEAEKKRKEEIKKQKEEKAKQKAKRSKKRDFSNSDKEAAALVLLRNNFKGKAKVWYDAEDKAFMIKPTGSEFKEELLDIVATQDTDDWETLTDSMDKLSRSLYKNLGLADFVSIVNPDNPDKVLYSSLNGESKYDFLNN
ncbi:capsid protein [Lactobacillus kefiranofaciens]|uniref:capsid protein n=2 Tax=Bacillati TaxID=1783272 RepID=UPI0024694A24|nr:capsid protein [Lactobacillus kefiranofaciens]MDH5100007.1 capsid protein [Lactobacillus kefiranofaciens]